jgi:hypothetical protein
MQCEGRPVLGSTVSSLRTTYTALFITFDSDLEFRRSVGYLFAVFHVFDARSGEDADGSIVAHVCFVRGMFLVLE